MKYKWNQVIPLTYLLVIFFISACRSELNNKLEISVVNEFKLSKQTQEYLSRIYPSIASNKDGEELAFSNYLPPIRIVITDYNGELIETIGKEGRGPEEIISARAFGFDDDNNILVLDKAGGLFKYYNRATGNVNSYVYPIRLGISITSRNLQLCEDRWYLGIQLLKMSTDSNVPIIGIFDTTFNLVDTLGGYDPFFKGRKDIMQEPVIRIDCENRRIYTTHGKVPYIQVFSMDSKNRIKRTTTIPSSFMLSDKFIALVTNSREMNRYLNEKQSLSLRIAHTDDYIYHVFANGRKIGDQSQQNRKFTDRDYFVAVYDKKSLEYLGEIKLLGPAIGSTIEGEIIVLKDESTSGFQFIKIDPVTEVLE